MVVPIFYIYKIAWDSGDGKLTWTFQYIIYLGNNLSKIPSGNRGQSDYHFFHKGRVLNAEIEHNITTVVQQCQKFANADLMYLFSSQKCPTLPAGKTGDYLRTNT